MREGRLLSFSGLSLERFVVSLAASALVAVLSGTALVGLRLPPALAVALVTGAAVPGALWLARRLPSRLDGVLGRHPVLAVGWLLLAVASIGTTARLATFMVDQTRSAASVLPFDEFFVRHSCISAPFQAALLERAGVQNVYERTHYEGPRGEPHFLDGFVIDAFFYPPPALLLAKGALALSEDFGMWRAVWFAAEGAIVFLALLGLACWIGNRNGLAAGLLVPVVWLSVPTLVTLQIGNFHLVAVAGAILSMLAFERGRNALGGLVLAVVTLTKVFPGILILYLLFRRQWRSAGWTIASAAGLMLLALAVLGPAPFHAFVSYQLPRLSSGEALETVFVYEVAIAANQSVYGVVQKLGLLGVPGMSGRTAATVTWLYGLVLVGLAARAAFLDVGGARRALVWLALLQLASLRSPFVPDVYAQFALLWMLALLLAVVGRRGRIAIALVGGLVLANLIVPNQKVMPLTLLLVLTLLQQLGFMALCAGQILRRPEGRTTPAWSG